MSNLIPATRGYITTGNPDDLLETLDDPSLTEAEILSALQLLIEDPKIKTDATRRRFLHLFIKQEKILPVFNKLNNKDGVLAALLTKHHLVFTDHDIQLQVADAKAFAGPGAGAGDSVEKDRELKAIQAFEALPATSKLIGGTKKKVFDKQAQDILKIAVESQYEENRDLALKTVFQRYSDDGRPNLAMFNVLYAQVQRPDLWKNFNSTFGEFNVYWGGNGSIWYFLNQDKIQFYYFLRWTNYFLPDIQLQDMNPYVRMFLAKRIYEHLHFHLKLFTHDIRRRELVTSFITEVFKDKIDKLDKRERKKGYKGPNLFDEYSQQAEREFEARRETEVAKIKEAVRKWQADKAAAKGKKVTPLAPRVASAAAESAAEAGAGPGPGVPKAQTHAASAAAVGERAVPVSEDEAEGDIWTDDMTFVQVHSEPEVASSPSEAPAAAAAGAGAAASAPASSAVPKANKIKKDVLTDGDMEVTFHSEDDESPPPTPGAPGAAPG